MESIVQNESKNERKNGDKMKHRKWIAWVLAGIMMLPGAGLGEKKPNAVKTKQILRTWLCAGE